jgi:hypothetical protein
MERATEAARESVRAVGRAEELASGGFDQAARGMTRAADARKQLAQSLESMAHAGRDERDELVERAREHRARAAGDLQEARVDHETAEDLRPRPVRGDSQT